MTDKEKKQRNLMLKKADKKQHAVIKIEEAFSD